VLNNVRTLKRRVASGLSNPEVLAAVAACNLRTRSVFHRLYEREERRLEEATDRIEDLEKELTRGGLEVPSAEEFRKFHDSRQRYERQAEGAHRKAPQGGELQAGGGEGVGGVGLAGLGGRGMEEALELVEEVEADATDDGFWKPYLDRVLGAVELYDDGHGALRTDLAGLENLRLETWELKAARRTVAAGGEAPTDRDRTLLKAVALRLKAEEETETLRAGAPSAPSAETLRAAKATLARAHALDAA